MSTIWPTKHVLERITAEFDFTADLSPGDSLSTVQFVVTTVRGTDASPGGVLFGAPQLKGARVFQQLAAGTAACSYRVECRATTVKNNILLIHRVLPVESF